ncbi:hypothetical protein QCB45_03325 [Thiomicrorhabdus sp. ZW0627]|uniref:hypothetical protein n=1 Tax=Thiomicrorhabdus sp. ZW0627 TaxID=3039774 RepID=UPI002436DA3A|nr:hypothetical protein [Thiomicrorhabdus sp. ZW0627]MDG6773351.1 hypothetical protein [Thiomicrorhabdus sp. ZW0627]
MDSLEKTKIQLLAHSRNMLNSALEEDWEYFSQLDSSWQGQLESAVSKYGQELDVIGAQLLEDNQQIQNCILRAQKILSTDYEKNTHAMSALKKYMK